MGASHTTDKWEVQFAAEFAQNTPPRNGGGPAFPAFYPVRFISPACGGDGERSDAREGKSPRLAQTSHRLPPCPPPMRGDGERCQRGQVSEACANVTQAPSLPSPASGGGQVSPFSRRAFAPELWPRHGKKALRASLKRREAERRQAHHWFPPRRREKSLPAYAARYVRPSSALARSLRGGALAFRRSTAVMRRGSYPPTRFRAALPGITGSKREDPLRHQCSQHLAVRSRAGRSMPRTARKHGVSPRFREPLSFHFRKYPRERPLRERDGDDVIDTGTDVKSQSQYRRRSLLKPSWPDLFRPSTSLARSVLKTWMPATRRATGGKDGR